MPKAISQTAEVILTTQSDGIDITGFRGPFEFRRAASLEPDVLFLGLFPVDSWRRGLWAELTDAEVRTLRDSLTDWLDEDNTSYVPKAGDRVIGDDGRNRVVGVIVSTEDSLPYPITVISTEGESRGNRFLYTKDEVSPR